MVQGVILKYITALLGAFTAAWLWAVGDMGFTLIIIAIVTCIDFCTGLMSARKNGGIKSHRITKSAFKLLGYTIAVVLANIICIQYAPTLPKQLISTDMQEWIGFIPHVIGAFIVIREAMSNIENLIAARVLPKNFVTILLKVKPQIKIDEYIDDLGDGADDSAEHDVKV